MTEEVNEGIELAAGIDDVIALGDDDGTNLDDLGPMPNT
jgi:hypothetical protein